MKDVITKTGCGPLLVNVPEKHPRKDGLQFTKVPTKGEGEDSNDSCHELQIRPCTLLLDEEHIQRGGCLQSCDIP
jgi:hypothetical protein